MLLFNLRGYNFNKCMWKNLFGIVETANHLNGKQTVDFTIKADQLRWNGISMTFRKFDTPSRTRVTLCS